jgi:DNA helicase-2/ATP-dependent DNA helicase PcrA
VTDAAPSDTAVTDAAPSDTAVTDAAPSDGAVNDPVFEAEQAHLTYTYAKLEKMARDAMVAMEAVANQAAHDKKTMSEELAVNFATWDDILETQAEIQAMNNIIEAHNMANSVQAERLRAVEVLLRCPYFAKIEVEFRKGQPLKELYIGSAGVSDENYKRLVVDWRSPVAEVYYNQSMGPTTYEADGRTIHVDLKLRRQFEIKRDQLLSYFDSDVAIEDKLLLASLAQGRSAHMKAITATIQREQNAVIRHADVPVLQVSGVAGSGKTSVLMQRIAYLFYQHRGSLDPNQVFLISPNPVFGRYIDKVLPDLGERNPEILTWEEFLAPLLPEGRGVGEGDVTFEQLERISKAVEHFEFDRLDFASIECEEVTFVSRETILKIAEKFGHLPAGPHRVTLMGEEITARVTERMKNLAANEDVHDEISGLPLNEQLNLFGEVFDPQDEIEARRLALTYIESKYAAAVRAAKRMEWLDVDHVAQRLMGRHGLTSVEWVYLKMALTGLGNPEAKYVMIDEVQDYSEGKLAVLARYFRRAHFLLLGDPNQAIFEKTASWAEARAVFERERGQVEQCSLMTSYRSTPAITDLFARLLPPEEALQVSSVQRESAAPRLLECKTPDEWLETLQEEVRRAAAPGTLVAVVVPWKNDAARLGKQLEGVTVIGEGNSLPAEGVVVLPLKLAKGLEFDYVIVPDVSERVFPESDIARRRLYTTLSRATRHVTLISRGALTPLLK